MATSEEDSDEDFDQLPSLSRPRQKPRKDQSDRSRSEASSRKAKRPLSKASSSAGISPTVLLIGGGALGLLLVVGAIGAFVFLRGQPAGNQAGGQPLNGAAARQGVDKPAELTGIEKLRAKLDLSRQPQPGPNSWVPVDGPESADTAKWAVQPDPPQADVGKFLRFVRMSPSPDHRVFGFGIHPHAGQWATLAYGQWKKGDGSDGVGLSWRRYRLTDSEPYEEVLLVENKEGQDHPSYSTDTLVLSPSGNRIAFYTSQGVEVWDATGKRIGSRLLKEHLRWLSFGGEDRVWLGLGSKNLSHDPTSRMTLWDPATNAEILAVPNVVSGHPTLSPGGKYVAWAQDDRISIRTAADGNEVGSMDKSPELVWGGLEFHPSGNALVSFLGKRTGDQFVSVWNLRDGRLTDHFFRKTSGAEHGINGVKWIGDRTLCLMGNNINSGGDVFELDLRAVTSNYSLPHGVNLQRGMPAPQAGHWMLRTFQEFEMPKLAAKVPDPKPGMVAFSVSSLPEEYTNVLKQARNGGVLWHRGIPCRLSIKGTLIQHKEIQDEQRMKLMRLTADRTAKLGYHLDDKAPLTLELVLDTPKSFGELAVYSIKSGVIHAGKRVVRSEQKSQSMQNVVGLHQLIDQGAEPHLPPLLLRDSQLKQIRFPHSYLLGVDEVLPAYNVIFPEDREDFTYGPQTVE